MLLALSWGFNTPKSLKTLNGRFGGNLNSLAPKLKRHCWKLMKDAAGKNPFLEKTNVISKSLEKD